MKHVICLLLTVITFCACAQFSKSSKYAQLIGYNYNNGHFAEIGVVRGYRCSYENNCEMVAQETVYSFISASSEFRLSNNFIACPKIGYHIIASFIHLGASIYDYTTLNKNEFGIRPEAGLSVFGIIGVQYGYNLPFLKQNDFDITNHNFSVKIILNSKLFPKS